MRDVCKYVLAGVAAFSAYQLTSDIVTQTGNAIESTIEWIVTKGLEKEYEIMGTMGRGKTSIIYRVRRIRDGKILALKVLNKLNIYAYESDAFHTERNILRQIDHSNIVKLEGSDSYAMYDQLELELATDGSLYSYIHDHGCLSELQTLRLICQMMNAIVYLYTSFNILHRDIKPENILLFKHNVVGGSLIDRFYDNIAREHNINYKLCDFGFSGNNNDKCGTLYYTHPDVFSGLQHHSLSSEIWSLGIVAHFALFGTNPYYKYCKCEDSSVYRKDICMEKALYKQLGPKLRRFFRFSLVRKNDISINEILSLYDKINEREFHSQQSSTTISKLHFRNMLSSMKLY